MIDCYHYSYSGNWPDSFDWDLDYICLSFDLYPHFFTFCYYFCLKHWHFFYFSKCWFLHLFLSLYYYCSHKLFFFYWMIFEIWICYFLDDHLKACLFLSLDLYHQINIWVDLNSNNPIDQFLNSYHYFWFFYHYFC